METQGVPLWSSQLALGERDECLWRWLQDTLMVAANPIGCNSSHFVTAAVVGPRQLSTELLQFKHLPPCLICANKGDGSRVNKGSVQDGFSYLYLADYSKGKGKASYNRG